jgi:hypothetical protein
MVRFRSRTRVLFTTFAHFMQSQTDRICLLNPKKQASSILKRSDAFVFFPKILVLAKRTLILFQIHTHYVGFALLLA